MRGDFVWVGEFLASYPTAVKRVFERINLRRDAGGWAGEVTLLCGCPDRFYVRSVTADSRRFVARMTPSLGAVEETVLLDLEVREEADGAIVLAGSRARLDSAGVPGTPTPFTAEHESRVRIENSEIQGHGVFAREDIPAGGVILTIRGERTSVQTPHSARIAEGVHCEPTGYLRYINHCCDANSVIDARNPDRPVLRASRPILAGDEVTFDYALNEGLVVADFACNCGAATHHL
jgi:hypothetical protein